MPINSVAVIAGALSFSAALAWNKAISETLTSLTKSNSPLFQAIVITIIIMITIFCINTGIYLYTNITGIGIRDSILNAGGNDDSKVKLFYI